MQKIPLTLAKPGMILAKPVTRPDGIAVAGAGSELSQGILDRFDSMGISHVVVEGEPVKLDGQPGGTSYDKRLERLEYLFRRFPEDKWMGQIRRLVDHYFRMKAAASAAMAEAARAASQPEPAPEAAGDAKTKDA
jgi:hypothetical protein